MEHLLCKIGWAQVIHHLQAFLFCCGCMGGWSKSRNGHNAPGAEIRCLFMISLVRKESDTALSQKKTGSSCHFCADCGEDKKPQAFPSFQSKEISVRYFSGRHVYALILLQTSWCKPETVGFCWCLSLIPVSQLRLSPVLTTTAPYWSISLELVASCQTASRAGWRWSARCHEVIPSGGGI